MAINWGQIESGATFHALVGDLLQFEDPLTLVFDRPGPDGAIDALSGDGKTVHQSKHHKCGTAANAISDAKAELEKIRTYRQPGHRWSSIWHDVEDWNLITNVPFGPGDEERWREEIVPAFSEVGLRADYVHLRKLETWLEKHAHVADAFFGRRPRLFVTLAEHRDVLVQRAVLQRSFDVPLVGRQNEIGTIADFASSSGPQVLLVHGAGGVGKSRLLVDVASQLVHEGVVDTVYCGTPHTAVSSDWYVGVLPEAKVLVVLDEPSDPGFIDRFLAELRSRTKKWKVLLAVRTPKDPVVRVLADPRDVGQLVAPPIEISPLSSDESARHADALLAPLQFSDEQRQRLTRWLVNVCGGFPIWMAIAVHLIEEQADLRDLPTDRFQIASRYMKEILDNTQPEIASRGQMLTLLRWVALVQPLSRQSDENMVFLAEMAGFEDQSGAERAVADLCRRRVLTAYGVEHRMVEVRPDVVRDFLLVDWLTFSTEIGVRRSSPDARGLAGRFAAAALEGSPMKFGEQIIRALGRMEFLIEPQIQFLDPIAEAAVSMAEAAADTLAQERAIDFAKTIAFLRPGHFARVANLIRTREVPEASHKILTYTFEVAREGLVNSLVEELAKAGRGANTGAEARSVLEEVMALIDWQADPCRSYRGNDKAADLLPRLIHGRHGYRRDLHGEAGSLADTALGQIDRGHAPRESWSVLLKALLDIDRHQAYSDDETVLHLESFRLLPSGEPGRLGLDPFFRTPNERRIRWPRCRKSEGSGVVSQTSSRLAPCGWCWTRARRSPRWRGTWTSPHQRWAAGWSRRVRTGARVRPA